MSKKKGTDKERGGREEEREREREKGRNIIDTISKYRNTVPAGECRGDQFRGIHINFRCVVDPAWPGAVRFLLLLGRARSFFFCLAERRRASLFSLFHEVSPLGNTKCHEKRAAKILCSRPCDAVIEARAFLSSSDNTFLVPPCR